MAERRRGLDCVVIGYNEMPFPRLAATMRKFGTHAAAYRDLAYSFVTIAGEPHTWIDLLNRSERQARARLGTADRFMDYRCGDIPNLAAVYLTNFLRRRGLAVDYINLFQHERDRLGDLLDADPVCVAITTTFYVTNHPAAEIVEFVRQRRPTVPVVLGGPLIANHVRRHGGEPPQTSRPGAEPHVAAELQVALDGLGADVYVVDAQGESTLYQVIETLKHGGALTNVPNLILPVEGGVSRARRLSPRTTRSTRTPSTGPARCARARGRRCRHERREVARSSVRSAPIPRAPGR